MYGGVLVLRRARVSDIAAPTATMIMTPYDRLHVRYRSSTVSRHLYPFLISKDEASGQISLTLQPSVVLDGRGGVGGGLTWSSERLLKGLKVKGRVAAVKDYGVFVQIDNSEVSRGSVVSLVLSVTSLWRWRRATRL